MHQTQAFKLVFPGSDSDDIATAGNNEDAHDFGLAVQVEPSSNPAFKVLVTRLSVAAESTGVIDISLDSAVSPGAVHGTVRVSLEELQTDVDAALSARVQDLAVYFSHSSVDFHQVALGSTRIKTVTVRNTIGVPVTLKAQVQNGSHLGVFHVQPTSIQLPPYERVRPCDATSLSSL